MGGAFRAPLRGPEDPPAPIQLQERKAHQFKVVGYSGLNPAQDSGSRLKG